MFFRSQQPDGIVAMNIRNEVPKYYDALKQVEDRIRNGGLERNNIKQLDQDVEDLNELLLTFIGYIRRNNCDNSLQVARRDYGTIGITDWIKYISTELYRIRTLINEKM